MSPPRNKLDAHDPEQTGEGQEQAEQVQADAGDDEGPNAGGREEGSYFDGAQDVEGRQQAWRIKQSRKKDLQDREASDRQYLCRALIARSAGLRGFCGDRCRRGGRLNLPRSARHLACRIAVAEQRAHRDRPSRGLQAPRQARDDDRVSAGLGEPVVPSDGPLEHVPADRQHFLGTWLQFRVGVGRRRFTQAPRLAL